MRSSRWLDPLAQKIETLEITMSLRWLRVLVALFSLSGFGFCAQAAQAATIFFSPSSGTYAVGQTFNVNVVVSSKDQAMNAISTDVHYPAALLDTVSFSKAGSILSLWSQQPSAAGGSVHIEGIVLNPGYTGASGRILTIEFKAKQAGSVDLTFGSSSVLANDGQGSEIYTGSGKAHFQIGPAAATPAPTPTPTPVVTPSGPGAVALSSPTYPDQSAWYSTRPGAFKWSLASDVQGISYLVDQDQQGIPDQNAISPVTQAAPNVPTDGVWYFHIRQKVADAWSKTSTYRFQIDTTDPSTFNITALAPQPGSDFLKQRFAFAASDTLSGIDRYQLSIDGGEPFYWKDDGTHVYETPELSQGEHRMLAEAIDRAGNSKSAIIVWNVAGPLAPQITDAPTYLPAGMWIVVHGQATPTIPLIATLQLPGGHTDVQTLTPNADGSWIFVSTSKADDGTYHFVALSQDASGLQSTPSRTATIVVQRPVLWVIYNHFAEANAWFRAFLLLFLLVCLCLVLLALKKAHQKHLAEQSSLRTRILHRRKKE